MALFVIVAGVLLMLGGAAALLAGFDIVMTERGSAMAIGGTIALSSGVVAVGIGFALLRLSQILRSLETRAAKPVRSSLQPDRPVVPTPSSATTRTFERSSEVLIQPDLQGLSSPRSSSLPNLGTGAAVGAAGLGAAGLGAAGMVVAGFGAAAYAQSSPSANNTLDHIETQIDRTNDLVALINDKSPADSISPDLEDELSRALAETESPADRDKQFTDGLSEFLTNPKSQIKSHAKYNADKNEQDNDILNPLGDEITTGEPQKSELQDSLVDDLSDASLLEHSLSAPDAVDLVSEADVDVLDAPSDQKDDSDHERAEEAIEADVSVTLDAYKTSVNEIVRPGILRTYNSGGKYYTMYVDGSVEALTDEGVERFNSMDELRAHLAGQ